MKRKKAPRRPRKKKIRKPARKRIPKKVKVKSSSPKLKKGVSVLPKYSHLLQKDPSPPKTVFDQVLDHFTQNVLQKPSGFNVTSKHKLVDFITDRRFEKEFKQMFLYRAQTFFGVSILKLYNEPIHDIINYLREVKMKSLYYNRPTIF